MEPPRRARFRSVQKGAHIRGLDGEPVGAKENHGCSIVRPYAEWTYYGQWLSGRALNLQVFLAPTPEPMTKIGGSMVTPLLVAHFR